MDTAPTSWVTDQNVGKAISGPTGGIYNLEFNDDGSMLAAACEQKNVLLFDPTSRRMFKSIENAHSDGVNCVKFLDQRMFATCSDDTTVALWDVRQLRKKIQTFKGHSYWVKNIEFSKKHSALITSGLDGAICLWDLNKYASEENNQNAGPENKIFHLNGLMRMAISSQEDKMVISTMNGYLIVVHDLDLGTFKEDLKDFKPNMYRLLQLSAGSTLISAANATPLFRRKRNRIEFISDFPNGNEAEFISSLKLHPQGWVAVTRNVSADESSEWCCVHDIHSAPPPEDDEGIEVYRKMLKDEEKIRYQGESNASALRRSRSGLATMADYISSQEDDTVNEEEDDEQEDEEEPSRRSENAEQEEREPQPIDQSILDAATSTLSSLTNRNVTISQITDESGRSSLRIRAQDVNVMPRLSPEQVNIEAVAGTSSNPQNVVGGAELSRRFPVVVIAPSSRDGQWVYFGTPKDHRKQMRESNDRDAKIYRNRARLTHYLEESNTGRGYIKEVSFMRDGRIFCSPFGFGVRLLAFDDHCTDLSLQWPERNAPQHLHEVGTLPLCHEDVVLASAFSPNSFYLVSGCLKGKVVWHQPLP